MLNSFAGAEGDYQGISLTTGNFLVFFCLWYTFTLFSYGTWIPSGILLPGVIMGISVGALYNKFDILVFDSDSYKIAPLLIGASAMLGGYL